MTGQNQIVIYQTKDGAPRLEVRLQEETVWLTQKQMADLFGIEVPAVSKHIKNIYATGELNENSTLSKMETIRQKGKRQVKRQLDHYSLDVIIAVGYRVNSIRGTQFRIRANKILKDYLVKDYALNEKRLKEKAKQLEELKKVVQPLNDYEKADLKKKFSRADQLNIAEQKINAICWDISKHFQQNFQGTPFKGQLVCQSKESAIKYKNFLDEIGIVSTALVMSPPDYTNNRQV